MSTKIQSQEYLSLKKSVPIMQTSSAVHYAKLAVPDNDDVKNPSLSKKQSIEGKNPYVTVDFEKTKALMQTKNDLERQRSLSVGTRS